MKLKTMNGVDLVRALKGGCANLEKHRDQVDMLNVFPVPDGDTGTNMFLTISSATKEAEKSKQSFLGKVIKPVSVGSLMGARGNSGVILSQIFRGLSKELEQKEIAEAKDFAKALKSGADTAYKAVMKPVEGTILTVIREVARAAEERVESTDDILEVLRFSIRAGNDVLQKTPQMLPALKEAGVVDSGGQGLLFFLEGFLASLAKESETELTETSGVHISEKEQTSSADSDINPDIALEFQYCTEMLIKGSCLDADEIKAELHPLGDSMLVVGGNELVKVHIHSNHPGQVLECGLRFGALSDIKINNMLEEVHERKMNFQEETTEELTTNTDSENSLSQVEKKIGLVAVAAGDGIVNILKSLGVDEVVHGGQTMNPSTEDILNACNHVMAENIIILPNNSNIIMAANQVKDICSKKVAVLPTKNVTQAIAALIAFQPEADLEEVEESMLEEMSRVTYGELTSAVRDSQVDGVEVKNGDYIGLIEGHIKIDGQDKETVLFELIHQMIQEDSEIMTILYGAEVSVEEAEEIEEKLQETFDWCEVEMHYGGQAHYDYLISVE